MEPMELVRCHNVLQEEQEVDHTLTTVRWCLLEGTISQFLRQPDSIRLREEEGFTWASTRRNGSSLSSFPSLVSLCLNWAISQLSAVTYVGQKRTLDRIQTAFFWPGMEKEITILTRSCGISQRTRDRGPAPLQSLALISEPFEGVAVDIDALINPSRTSDGSKYILIFVDSSTRWSEAVPFRNIEAVTVDEALIEIFAG